MMSLFKLRLIPLNNFWSTDMPKKVITKENLPYALSILDKWTGKLTWNKYAEKLAEEFGLSSISRFTLIAYKEIETAFAEKKKQLRDIADVKSQNKNVTIEYLQNIIIELEAKNKRYEDTINRYKEQFVRWQYNLYFMPGADLSKIDTENHENKLREKLNTPLTALKRSEW